MMNSERPPSCNVAVHLCARTMCALPSRSDVNLCYTIVTVNVRIADKSDHEICGAHSGASEDSGLLGSDLCRLVSGHRRFERSSSVSSARRIVPTLKARRETPSNVSVSNPRRPEYSTVPLRAPQILHHE